MTSTKRKSTLRLVNPEERFDRLTFDPRPEALDHVIHFGHYACPGCKSVIRFQFTDFLEDADSRFSPADLARFNAVFGINRSYPTPRALDFYCPGCKQPVRIIYEAHEFAMGSYFFTLTCVVESTR